MTEALFETQNDIQTGTNIGIDLDGIPFHPVRPRILIVDDDQNTVALLKLVLVRAGYDVAGAQSGDEALEKCAMVKPHVVLLDLMMPGMDGFEVFCRLREQTQAPVIIVSADTRKEMVVKGLNLGVDDYVTKPYHGPEIIARVSSVLRRYSNQADQGFTKELPNLNIVVDFDNMDVLLDGKSAELTPTEYELFALLARRTPRVVSYEEIASHIWNETAENTQDRIKYLVYLVRKKLETNPNQIDVIVNRRGIGYLINSSNSSSH